MELILTDLLLSVCFLDKQVKEIQDDIEKLSPHTIKHTKKVRDLIQKKQNLLRAGLRARGQYAQLSWGCQIQNDISGKSSLEIPFPPFPLSLSY